VDAARLEGADTAARPARSKSASGPVMRRSTPFDAALEPEGGRKVGREIVFALLVAVGPKQGP